MTPQVTTTSCYVRIDDAQQRKEVREKLYSIGYLLGQHSIDALDNIIITYPKSSTFCIGNDGMYDDIDLKVCIDCGTNIPLFLDLAGMRSDTDKNQLFVNESLEKMFRCKDKKFTSFYVDWEEGLTNIRDDFRRATAQEIINHHKQKGETK